MHEFFGTISASPCREPKTVSCSYYEQKKINEDKNAQGQTGDVSRLQDSVTRSEKSLREETTDWGKKTNTGSCKSNCVGAESEFWMPCIFKTVTFQKMVWQEHISV